MGTLSWVYFDSYEPVAGTILWDTEANVLWTRIDDQDFSWTRVGPLYSLDEGARYRWDNLFKTYDGQRVVADKLFVLWNGKDPKPKEEVRRENRFIIIDNTIGRS